MNIMFLFYAPIVPHIGGVQKVTHILTEAFLKRGYHVVFVSTSFKGLIEKNNFIVPQHHIELAGKSAEEITEQIQDIVNKYDITHVVSQTLDKAYLFKYFPAHVKKIATCHIQPFSFMGITRKRIWNTNARNARQLLFKCLSLLSPRIHEKFFYNLEKRALEESYQYADKICFISEHFFPRIKKYMPAFPQDKFVAINNPNTFDVSKIRLPEEKENIILWVGRVDNAQKNATDFVKMWRYLSQKEKNWKAIMIGDGKDLAYIKKYAKKHNLERIEFTGRRNDTEIFYKKAKVVAVTSYWESWCMVLTEGMSYGCIPFVYDTYETLRDIVDDKKNGYIIPKISYKLMADKIKDTIQENRFKELAIAAQEKVKKFDVEQTVDKWEKLLNSL